MNNDSKEPILTVVMPVRNRAALLPRTLLSIERQTLRPLKTVIADNGSTDSTPQIIEQWRQRVEPQGISVTVVSEPRPGASVARNAALAKVTTPYTLHFDSDDEMLPDHLAMVDAYLRLHPRHGDTPVGCDDHGQRRMDDTEERRRRGSAARAHTSRRSCLAAMPWPRICCGA